MNKSEQSFFESIFRWNISYSLLFEFLKIGHNICLAYLLHPTKYGLVGTIFSLIYLIANLIDIGTSYTFSPFTQEASLSQKQFKHFFIIQTLLPLSCATIFILSIYQYIVTFCSVQNQISGLILFTLIPLIAVSEMLRTTIRHLLHTMKEGKYVLVAEFVALLFFLVIIWVPELFTKGFFILPQPMFLLYFLYSIGTTLTLALRLYVVYRKLPQKILTAGATHQKIKKLRILKIRLSNFIIKLSSHLTSANILTPLFAYKFGLAQGGLFYFVNTLAMTMRSIFNATIRNSGDMLFAQKKMLSDKEQQEAFSLLKKKGLLILIPSIVFLFLVYSIASLYIFNTQIIDSQLILIGLAYLIIKLCDLLLIPYESFMTAQESLHIFTWASFIQALIFYSIIFVVSSKSLLIQSLFLLKAGRSLFIFFYPYKGGLRSVRPHEKIE